MPKSYIYITTNTSKTVLYTGVTSNLNRRLIEHENDAKSSKLSFAGKYNCYHLVYFEEFNDIREAIEREKKIKGWTRAKKVNLINTINEEWKFFNDSI